MSIEEAVSIINNSESILVICGAGISVSAGIPDFRSPKTGIYDQLAHYNLPTPTSIFDVKYFIQRPRPFYSLSKSIFPSQDFKNTITHAFLAYLQSTKKLKILTQNIDDLEAQAGATATAVHGSFLQPAKCVICAKQFESINLKAAAVDNSIAFCSCGGPIKPGIVFFGEGVNLDLKQVCQEQFDCILVLGTSLKVGPINQLPLIFECPKIFINREEAEEEYQFDQFLQGDCDDIVEVMLEQMGSLNKVRNLRQKSLEDVQAWGDCYIRDKSELQLICVGGGLRVPTGVSKNEKMYCLSSASQIQLLQSVYGDKQVQFSSKDIPQEFQSYVKNQEVIQYFESPEQFYQPIYGHYSAYLTQFIEYYEQDLDIWDIITDKTSGEFQIGVPVNIMDQYLSQEIENVYHFQQHLQIVKTRCVEIIEQKLVTMKVKLSFEENDQQTFDLMKQRLTMTKSYLINLIFTSTHIKCGEISSTITDERFILSFNFLEKEVENTTIADIYTATKQIIKKCFDEALGMMLIK